MAVLGAVAGAVAVGATGPASGQERRERTAESSDLAKVRAATARFHDVAVAEAAGYVPVSPCEELPGSGAMGVHT